MGGGSTSPWHNQNNNPTLTLTTTTPKRVKWQWWVPRSKMCTTT